MAKYIKPPDILHSEDVNEILTSTPKWILRWGITVVLILIFVALTLSYFIRYPDVLIGEITLTTLNPPVLMVSRSSGKITKLLTKNHDLVKVNEILAVLENTANYEDVLSLLEIIRNHLKKLNLSDSISQVNIPENLMMGELTPFYLEVLKAIKDYNLYKTINASETQIALLKKDLTNYYTLINKYKAQIGINDEELVLTETDYHRDTLLFRSGAISSRETDAKRREYLRALSNNEQFRIMLTNVLIQINSIEKSILQLQIQNFQDEKKLRNELLQRLKTLISETDNWKQNYIVESPIDGKISFFNIWTINQNVNLGDEMFAIVPSKKQEFIGKCTIPIENSGKLSIGQNVNIKLDNYPPSENGTLSGSIYSVSEVPNKDLYAVDIKLKNGLITSYQKVLVYKEEMKGKAEIITKNISVLDRIFFSVKRLLEKN